MTFALLTFDECLSMAKSSGHIHALLGNGFSRACRNDIFSYAALFDRADFAGLSPHCRATFDALGTTDFEVVIKSLNSAASILETYSPASTALAAILRDDAVKLREVLVSAIAGSHPEWPGEIAQTAYQACTGFLANFERVYTLNYDLLLYWAFMQEEIAPHLECDDGFRHPDSGPEEYVTWEVENSYEQRIYYLHGALHLFDAGSELQKYTWKNTGIRLKQQIRAALASSKYPLFVSEGTSQEKLERIKHSGYLHRGLASMPKVTGSMFVYGLSFAPNDEHVIRMLEIGKIGKLFVGVYGDPSAQHNKEVITRASKISQARKSRTLGRKRAQELEVHFYDAQSAKVWG
ncbi:MAG: DUF4917 family protein [Polaromonas sp.]|uniref:DUF4917 family protein n=1 Tax=Polaromonas sp. TaxID=1869339 RepID=UPI0024881213|nr:DUF4917 family protein [Polaromonas sp.]MDI1268915.1 DUF4917 family protein [Polaromonas sp.]